MSQKTIINNLFEKIESAKFDEAVGIRVAHLTGSEEFSLFGAEIGPLKKVGAHYHKSGLEIYQIVVGRGKMHLGITDENNNVTWTKSLNVTKGDCFTVNEGEVHQLINELDSKLVAIFGCPKAHLSTDRIVVEGYQESNRQSCSLSQ